MKIYTCIILILFSAQISYATQDTYNSKNVTQSLITNIEDSKVLSEAIQLPQIVTSPIQDSSSEAALDNFPFGPIRPILPIIKPKKPDIQEESWNESDRLIDGDLFRKLKESLSSIITVLTNTVSIIIYLIPIAVLGYFGGAFFGGIAATIYGLAYIRKAIIALREKKEED